MSFCLGAAKGLRHVHAIRFIHRDVAARSMLVDAHETVRVARFGSSVKLDDASEVYLCEDSSETIALRWAAPEVLRYHRYSEASDVWAFGVLMYEIFAVGAQPYAGLTAEETALSSPGGRHART